ncbi:MAG: cupin domain-containing protein [Anaerolineae bacterium]|nr:cupin domain-containing protein [Thermoflexales bacterium]MDW8406709.1 cupin domain-containing protein [Anaerolineae bacterium]
MDIFSIHHDDVVLCDTPLSYAELRRLKAGESIANPSAGRTETILCVVEGELAVAFDEAPLWAMQGVHIPAGALWSATAGASGAKVLRIDSRHPDFDPARALMPALPTPERFEIADGLGLTYTDYFRSRVLNFAPQFAAERHFHEGADELFWFYQGTARVTTPQQDAVLPAGSIIVNPAGEWHIIANASADQPLRMFLTVAPNRVPSHTFFDDEGRPVVRNMAPLTRP